MRDRRLLGHRVGAGREVGHRHRDHQGAALLDQQVVADHVVGKPGRRRIAAVPVVQPLDRAGAVGAEGEADIARGEGGVRVGVIGAVRGLVPAGLGVVVKLHHDAARCRRPVVVNDKPVPDRREIAGGLIDADAADIDIAGDAGDPQAFMGAVGAIEDGVELVETGDRDRAVGVKVNIYAIIVLVGAIGRFRAKITIPVFHTDADDIDSDIIGEPREESATGIVFVTRLRLGRKCGHLHRGGRAADLLGDDELARIHRDDIVEQDVRLDIRFVLVEVRNHEVAVLGEAAHIGQDDGFAAVQALAAKADRGIRSLAGVDLDHLGGRRDDDADIAARLRSRGEEQALAGRGSGEVEAEGFRGAEGEKIAKIDRIVVVAVGAVIDCLERDHPELQLSFVVVDADFGLFHVDHEDDVAGGFFGSDHDIADQLNGLGHAKGHDAARNVVGVEQDLVAIERVQTAVGTVVDAGIGLQGDAAGTRQRDVGQRTARRHIDEVLRAFGNPPAFGVDLVEVHCREQQCVEQIWQVVFGFCFIGEPRDVVVIRVALRRRRFGEILLTRGLVQGEGVLEHCRFVIAREDHCNGHRKSPLVAFRRAGACARQPHGFQFRTRGISSHRVRPG